MAIVKESFTVNLSYEMTIDVETGEIIETKLLDRTVNKPTTKSSKVKKTEKDEDPEPKVYLEENKLQLNKAALDLMKISKEDNVKLDVKYDNSRPVIGTDDAFGTKGGNKLTKAGAIAFRGNKNEELSKHGDVFTLKPHPTKGGLFILDSGKEPIEPVKDETISIDEGDADLPFDLDLSEIVEDKDAEITEIDSNFFNLNL